MLKFLDRTETERNETNTDFTNFRFLMVVMDNIYNNLKLLKVLLCI